MKETLELRVATEFLDLVFPQSTAKDIGSQIVKKVVFSPNELLLKKISKVNEDLIKTQNRAFFYGWQYHRTYNKKELEEAELFQLMVTAFYSSEGTEYGSVYDNSKTCIHCGVGRQLVGDLILDLSKLPKNKDFVETLSKDEWIVSEKLMTLILENDIRGATFTKVRDSKGRNESASNWYQLKITGPLVEITIPTKFGINPIDADIRGLYHCPKGHVLGLNILSELYIKKETYNPQYDIALTRQFVGRQANLIMPRPFILISPRLRQLLITNNIKGFKTESAYLL